MVRCARHRCPEACCKFSGDDEYVKTGLGRFQEREYYLNNTIHMGHCCDIMFLFLRHIDEHVRLYKLFEAIKESLVEWNKPAQNTLQV